MSVPQIRSPRGPLPPLPNQGSSRMKEPPKDLRIEEIQKRLIEFSQQETPKEFDPKSGIYFSYQRYHHPETFKNDQSVREVSQALVDLTEKCRKNPDDIEMKSRLVLVYLHSNQYEEAKRVGEEIKAINPHHYLAYYIDYHLQLFKGIGFKDKQSIENAILALKRCLAVAPTLQRAVRDQADLKSWLLPKFSKREERAYLDNLLDVKDPFENENIDFSKLQLSEEFLKKYPRYLNKKTNENHQFIIDLKGFDGSPVSLQKALKQAITPERRGLDLFINLSDTKISDRSGVLKVMRDAIFANPRTFRIFFFRKEDEIEFLNSFQAENTKDQKFTGNGIDIPGLKTNHDEIPEFYGFQSGQEEGEVLQRYKVSSSPIVSADELEDKNLRRILYGKTYNVISESTAHYLKSNPKEEEQTRLNQEGRPVKCYVVPDKKFAEFMEQLDIDKQSNNPSKAS